MKLMTPKCDVEGCELHGVMLGRCAYHYSLVENVVPDPVNHPSHYRIGKIEVIDAIEEWGLGFHLGNTVKYVARADHKGKPIEDLEKARWYLTREIERRRRLEETPYCEVHRVTHDEQQASQDDVCVDCGRTRPEHRAQKEKA